MSLEGAFSDQDARAGWDEGAQAWEEFVESGADYYRHSVHGPALLAVCEPLAGLRILDLGCGQGFFCRELARCGARVVGIDISEQQLGYALKHEAQEPVGIEYRLMSAGEVDQQWTAGSFDLVSGCMSLHDMADPASALRAAYRVLGEGGRMVFSVPHPCTDTPYREWEVDEAGNLGALKINHYFESGARVCHWGMRRLIYHWDTPYWRHSIAGWSALIAEAGFLIRRLHEPRPTEEQVASNPHIEDARRLPSFLIFDLVKVGVRHA